MDKYLKLLVLTSKNVSKDQLGFRIGRIKTINSLTELGAKIRHDSGGRLIIIEISKEVENAIEKSISGARVIPVDSDMKDEISGLSSDELLFLSALKMRASKKYRSAKKSQKPGDSLEEQKLFSGSCVRNEL